MNNYKKLTPLLFSFFVLYYQQTLPMIQIFGGHAAAAQAAGAGQMALTAQAQEPLRMAGGHAPVAHANIPQNTILFAQKSLLARAYAAYYPQGFHDQKGRTELLQNIKDSDQPITVVEPNDPVVALAWSPDSSLVATASWHQGTATTWDVQTGAKKVSMEHFHRENSERFVQCVAFSPDSRFVFSGAKNGTIGLWDAQTGQVIGSFIHPDQHYRTEQLALHPRKPLLLTAHQGLSVKEGAACVWCACPEAHLLHTLKHDAWVNTAAWNGDGTQILSASDDGTARIWDANDGNLVHSLAHGTAVHTAVWSPDSRYIATAGADKKAYVWDAQTGKKKFSLLPASHLSQAIKWSHHGKMIAIISGDIDRGVASIYEADTGKIKFALAHENGEQAPTSQVISAAWSPDSRYLATGGYNGTICIWDMQTGTKQITLFTPFYERSKVSLRRPPYQISWSPDSKLLAASFFVVASKACIWDISHLFDQNTKEECQAFKEGRLQPEQYMLLDLLARHEEQAHATYNELSQIKEPTAQTKEWLARSVLHEIMRLAQADVPEISIKDAMNALMLFSPTLTRMILHTYGIKHDKLVFELAKEKLFELDQSSSQAAAPKPLLQGDTVKMALRDYLVDL